MSVLIADDDDLPTRQVPGAVVATPEHLIDQIRRDQLDLSDLRRAIALVPRARELEFSADIGFILSKAPRVVQVVLCSEMPLNEDSVARLPAMRWKSAELTHHERTSEGRTSMAKRGGRYIQDEAALKKQVTDMVRQIHDDEDPLELNAYKRFIKRNVSIFARAYFSAYLLKMLAEGDLAPSRSSGSAPNSRRRRNEERRSSRERTPREREERTTEPAPQNDGQEPVGNVAPENRQTLFVSVGKNRRVYPKDFVALFAELEGVSGDDIGQIKILDNYSFVEVDQRVADTIIEAYNGFDFRGRKLTVNLARAKKE